MFYPLIFHPRFKERVWGGRTLETLYRKPLPAGVPIGESWEISDRPGDASVIANGAFGGRDLRWLMEEHGEEVGAALALRIGWRHIRGLGERGRNALRRAREAGFDQHLTKPMDPAALGKLLLASAARAPTARSGTPSVTCSPAPWG